MADVIETLAKLKPAAPDRDAILFAAGRASARRAPAWRFLLAGLAIQQVALLGLWFAPEKTREVVRDQVPEAPALPPAPPTPQSPSADVGRTGSLLDLNSPSTEPIPTASVVPEDHWTVRSGLRID